MKFLFMPISIAAGLLAGLLAKKIFERLWSLIDEEEPPRPEQRELSRPKLIAALAIEGAIFRLIKGVTDHSARRAFAKSTGTWPGEEEPQSDR
jgi:hypothetical protein